MQPHNSKNQWYQEYTLYMYVAEWVGPILLFPELYMRRWSLCIVRVSLDLSRAAFPELKSPAIKLNYAHTEFRCI